MRVCLNISITQMVVKHEHNSTLSSEETCPVLDGDQSTGGGSTGGIYDWDEEFQGVILSSFYWG